MQNEGLICMTNQTWEWEVFVKKSAAASGQSGSSLQLKWS